MTVRCCQTLDFGLSLAKRLQAVTFNPAVFRADILASMFDIFTHKRIQTRSNVCRKFTETTWKGLKRSIIPLCTCSSDCWTCAAAVATWSSKKASSVSEVAQLILRAHCSSSPSAPSRPYTAPAARYTCGENQLKCSLQITTNVESKQFFSLTFSSILVSLWSSLRVSELLDIGEALMDSEGV